MEAHKAAKINNQQPLPHRVARGCNIGVNVAALARAASVRRISNAGALGVSRIV